MNDLGLDSLDVVEIVMAYEDEFGECFHHWYISAHSPAGCELLFYYLCFVGVEISDEEAEKIFTCKDGIELLKTKMDIH